MVRYESTKQLTIEEFKTPFYRKLSKENRWVKLSEVVPWDRFAEIYMEVMDKRMGRPGVSPRTILGALIIKHIKKLDDRGVIEEIQENPYMQYFVGLKEFTTEPVFDPSLFVEIRKRIGKEAFDQMNEMMIKSVTEKKGKASGKKKDKEENDGADPTNKGKLQIDATVADQYIKFPTDTNLMNEGRKKLEKIIDDLYEKKGKEGSKPRTYRRKLDQAFLSYSKKRNKSTSSVRKMKRKLLESLARDLRHIDKMLDEFDKQDASFPLNKKELKYLWVIRLLYEQQLEMYAKRTHSIEDRIVNIHQPYVRPIVRGKEKSKTEFGAKLEVSLDNGFVRLDKLGWDAYNEGNLLISQVESYRALHGHYPELVQADKIFANRENRRWLKERGIRITAAPLGRPPKQEKLTYYQKRKRKKESAERNAIEGKFGQAKNGYELNRIRAKLQNTSESWISAILFVINLLKYEKEYFLSLILRLIFGKIFLRTELICINGNKNC